MTVERILLIIAIIALCRFHSFSQSEKIAFTKSDAQEIKKSIDKTSFFQLPINTRIIDFNTYQRPLIGDNLQKRFLNHKTYDLSSDDPFIRTGKLLISPNGVYFVLLTQEGLITIKPDPESEDYILDKGNKERNLVCGNLENINRFKRETYRSDLSNGQFLRTYRLALICTGEFYEENGNNDNDMLDAVLFTLIGLNVIYENDMAITFELGDRLLWYTDKDNDPFTPDMDAGASNRTIQAGIEFNNSFNAMDYDLGHVLHNHLSNTSWTTGGLALVGSVCNDDVNSRGAIGKGRGWAGNFFNNNNLWLEIVSHEVGHMLGATHTFNGTGESCTNNINLNNAVEIGSGTTIMSYNGICSSDQNVNVSGENNLYFHISSIIEILSFIEGIGTCYSESQHSNNIPLLEMDVCDNEPFSIPIGTPFTLTGKASDLDNDLLTYCWEQVDEDGIGVNPTQGFIGDQAAMSPIAPIFRSRRPSVDPQRVFPKIDELMSGTENPFEVLTQVKRTSDMRITVRDNFPGSGAIASKEIKLHFDNGPLEITYPSGTDIINGGEDFILRWKTNGSSTICDEVTISLVDVSSIFSEEFIIAENVDYASEEFQMYVPPSVMTSQNLRLKIECQDYTCYTFFQVSEELNYDAGCETNNHLLCNTDSLTAEEGNPSLILDLDHYTYESNSSLILEVDDQDDALLFSRNTVNGDCQTVKFSSGNDVFTRQDFVTFQVSESGTYLFSKEGGTFYTIFDESTFDPQDPCGSFIESNGRENPDSENPTTTFVTNSITVELEKCRDYLMMASYFTMPGEIVITHSGPGEIISFVPQVGETTFAYVLDKAGEPSTYLSVVTDDLRHLDHGNYTLYSIQIPTSEPISTYDNQSIQSLLNGRSCLSLSSNSKFITITPGDRDNDGFTSLDDCDDLDPGVNPSAEEIPNNEIDEDCNGVVLIIDEDMDGSNSDDDCNDNDPTISHLEQEIPNNDIDEDCDGVALIIDEDMDGSNSDDDCNDNDPTINPSSQEIPNNDVDENCDGVTLIIDEDMDGSNSDDDCNDRDPGINPLAQEIPNNDIDEDCDGVALIIDEDMDGSNSDDDCNDNDPAINPSSQEIPNNDIDEDCDGVVLIIDEDMDGSNSDDDCDDNNPDVYPSAEEIPNNGIDEDCDGLDASTSTVQVGSITLDVFPNPVSSYLNIEGQDLNGFTISIYNIQGVKIFDQKLNGRQSTIDFSELASATYLLHLKNKNDSPGKFIRIIKL